MFFINYLLQPFQNLNKVTMVCSSGWILSLYTISDSAMLHSTPGTMTSIPNEEKPMPIQATNSSISRSSSYHFFYCPKRYC